MRKRQELTEQEVPMTAEPREDELTAEEQKAYLDSRIRGQVRWAVKSNEISSFHENNDALIKAVSQRIYDGIVSDIVYNKTVLKATRAVKFNADYVGKVVRNGLASGSIVLSEAASKELDNLTEGMLVSDDLERRIHDITCLVARESLQR